MTLYPKEIGHREDHQELASSQLAACNVEPFIFNWFSGEHLLSSRSSTFPRMPRHNYSQAALWFKSLCAKHGLATK